MKQLSLHDLHAVLNNMALFSLLMNNLESDIWLFTAMQKTQPNQFRLFATITTRGKLESSKSPKLKRTTDTNLICIIIIRSRQEKKMQEAHTDVPRGRPPYEYNISLGRPDVQVPRINLGRELWLRPPRVRFRLSTELRTRY